MPYLSPSEKKGILILCSVILLGFIIQYSQSYKVKTELYDYSVQDSIFFSVINDSISDKTYTSAHINPKSPKKSVKKVPRLKSIDINKATINVLEKLPRIGPATARGIIEYREKHGGFKKIEDIQNVKRIGPKTFNLIKPYIYISEEL